jgi:hypothetical protein
MALLPLVLISRNVIWRLVSVLTLTEALTRPNGDFSPVVYSPFEFAHRSTLQVKLFALLSLGRQFPKASFPSRRLGDCPLRRQRRLNCCVASWGSLSVLLVAFRSVSFAEVSKLRQHKTCSCWVTRVESMKLVVITVLSVTINIIWYDSMQTARNSRTFRRNMLPRSSDSKRKPGIQYLLFVYSAPSSALQMETVCSSET